MKYEVLYQKFLELLKENYELKERNKNLTQEIEVLKSNSELRKIYSEKSAHISGQEKIKIFSELFLGRKDVYAKRWKNKLGKSGYSPVCKNEWDYNLCDKLKRGCSNCQNKKYLPIDNKIIESHLRGEIVVGIYPLLKDETCNFIAIDFDKKDWESSIKSLYLVCKENKIDALIERSRSGNGGHLWIFFSESVSASIARKLATGLINKAMCKNNNLSFDSYDRIFPNQDTMPKGNLGNLIALPLQKEARQKNNSVFVNEDFILYQNQWEKLRSIQKLSLEEIQNKIYEFSEEDNFMIDNQIIGKFKNEDSRNLNLEGNEFPLKVKIIKRNSLYVDKLGFSSKAINIIRRLAIFKNPEFYKFQAMRMSTYGKPRVINCSEEDERYLILPRGCEEKLFKLLKEQKSEIEIIDNRGLGRKINVSFKGKLYLEQKKAFGMMSYCEIGVLSATTAFGKTVVAASLIAKKGVSTLILVHRQQLLDQWKVRMEEFLEIKEEKPKYTTKTGRIKERDVIGVLGGGKNSINGIVDIAIIQSLGNREQVEEYAKKYGMVIIDECHHISAFSFEKVMKNFNCKYVYGFTATPHRKDGHDPIIFMQCGDIRYTVDTKTQLEEKKLNSTFVPVITEFNLPLEYRNMNLNISDIYSFLAEDLNRNILIISEVLKSYEAGKNILLLTERVIHAKYLYEQLKNKIEVPFLLIGGRGKKQIKEELDKIKEYPQSKNLVIIATGKLIGEGFDEPKLDTLFLAMPISWRGTLQQYAGRLHRIYKNKEDITIYDYVDSEITMLANMYKKRLKGYELMGYTKNSTKK